MSTFIVGLTGGIASGKSEVSRRFEALGITVADADIAAREVVATGSLALEQIAARFGTDMLLADGSLLYSNGYDIYHWQRGSARKLARRELVEGLLGL